MAKANVEPLAERIRTKPKGATAWTPDKLDDKTQATRVWKWCREWAKLKAPEQASLNEMHRAMVDLVPGFDCGRSAFTEFLKRLQRGIYGENK